MTQRGAPHAPGEVRSVRMTLCDGRYELHEPIGIGGTATVFRAHDRRMEVDRAVKLLHPFVAEDEVALSRFLDEARALARLEHPHVVRIYDLGHEGEHWFCVMELVRSNLASVVTRGGPVAPLRALRWTFEVLLALDAAHRIGVLHRDVRPPNVLLAADESARLADFGVALLRQRITGVTVTGEAVGDGAWVAPEQRDDPRIVGPQADLYAAGVLLLYLVLGQRPSAIGHRFVTDLRDSVERVPPSLREVLYGALDPDPSERFASTTAMITALAFAHDRHAASIGEPPRGAVWQERLAAQRAALGEG